MLTRYKHNNVTWIDLESPTNEEVRKIMEEYEIHPHVAEELLLPSVKPHIEFWGNSVIYLILHFPAFKHTHTSQKNQEVDFIIGKNFLITTRYDTIDPIHKFAKLFEVDSILDKNNTDKHAGHVFYYMIKKLYHAIEHELEYIGDSLREIEQKVFEEREREMVFDLSKISRELLDFKQTLSAHREILETFEAISKKFFEEQYMNKSKKIINEYFRIQNSVAAKMDLLRELRATNNSLLTTKQNETIKVLTIMAFVTFPLSLFASIFGMNTKTLPLTGFYGDFWVILGIMLLAAVFFFIFFKYKKWL